MTDFYGTDANAAIVDFFFAHGSKMPETPRNKMRQEIISGNPRSQCVIGMEALYASRNDVDVADLLEPLSRFVFAVARFGGAVERGMAINEVALRIQNGGEAAHDSDLPIHVDMEEPAPEPEDGEISGGSEYAIYDDEEQSGEAG